MGLPWPLFHLFSYFQTNTTILQPIDMKKCQSSIRCWDSNPQSSKYESPPITTRPGLLPKLTRCFSAVDSIKCFLLRLQKTSGPAFDSRSARFNKVNYNLKVIEPWTRLNIQIHGRQTIYSVNIHNRTSQIEISAFLFREN